MDEDAPEQESEKPRFLLPEGCKDLIDAIRLKEKHTREPWVPGEALLLQAALMPTPELPASVLLPDPVVVLDLASALHLKPVQVIRSLMELGIFAAPNTALAFKSAAALCFHYGVAAIKAA